MLDLRPGGRRDQNCDANHHEFVICRTQCSAVQIGCGAAILGWLLLLRELGSGFLGPFQRPGGEWAGDYVKPTNPAGQERSAMARPDTNWPISANTGTRESANIPSLRNVIGENRGAADPWAGNVGQRNRFRPPRETPGRATPTTAPTPRAATSWTQTRLPNFLGRIKFLRSVRVSNLEFGRQAACTSPKCLGALRIPVVKPDAQRRSAAELTLVSAEVSGNTIRWVSTVSTSARMLRSPVATS